jgi:hypothetical protein
VKHATRCWPLILVFRHALLCPQFPILTYVCEGFTHTTSTHTCKSLTLSTRRRCAYHFHLIKNESEPYLIHATHLEFFYKLRFEKHSTRLLSIFHVESTQKNNALKGIHGDVIPHNSSLCASPMAGVKDCGHRLASFI